MTAQAGVLKKPALTTEDAEDAEEGQEQKNIRE